MSAAQSYVISAAILDCTADRNATGSVDVDKVIGRIAQQSRLMKQLPTDIRVSREARDVFIDRMRHFKVYDFDLTKPLRLFNVPIMLTPGIPKYHFEVSWLDYAKLLRRGDKKF